MIPKKFDIVKIYDDFWGRLRHDKPNTFEFLSYLGYIPLMPIPLYPRAEPSFGSLVTYLSEFHLNYFQSVKGDYVYSWPTQKTLDVSVRKMDRKVATQFRSDVNHYRALQFVEDMFKECLNTRHMTIEEVVKDINWTKAAGPALAMSGYKKKSDVLSSGYLSSLLDESVMRVKPVWKAVGKEEYRTREDYFQNFKQRTFIIEPLELLIHRKRLFGIQNERMKMVGWSAYGLNPYEGGVSQLARKLKRHHRFFMLDGKLWDRIFAILREVYDIKIKGIPYDPFLEWVVDNGIESTIILPDGSVVSKSWGNNSGSGCTTVDNVLGMAVMIAHSFFHLGCSTSTVSDIVCNLFGDDVIGSHSLPDSITDEMIEQAFRDVFGMYGVELDPFLSSNDLTQFSFLGFTFEPYGDSWIPKYDLPRLAYSFLYEPVAVRAEAELSKLASLMLMSAGNGEEVFNQFREALCDVVLNVDCKDALLLRENNFSNIPNYLQVIDWYLGLECVSESFYKFLEFTDGSVLFMEDGRYKKNYGKSSSGAKDF